MTTRKSGFMSAGLLAVALIATSPLTLAGNPGPDYKRPSMDQMCKNMQEGKGRASQEERRARMDKRQADMAERLKLNEEQRQIWNQIHEERRAEHKQRSDKWKEKWKSAASN